MFHSVPCVPRVKMERMERFAGMNIKLELLISNVDLMNLIKKNAQLGAKRW